MTKFKDLGSGGGDLELVLINPPNRQCFLLLHAANFPDSCSVFCVAEEGET